MRHRSEVSRQNPSKQLEIIVLGDAAAAAAAVGLTPASLPSLVEPTVPWTSVSAVSST